MQKPQQKNKKQKREENVASGETKRRREKGEAGKSIKIYVENKREL